MKLLFVWLVWLICCITREERQWEDDGKEGELHGDGRRLDFEW